MKRKCVLVGGPKDGLELQLGEPLPFKIAVPCWGSLGTTFVPENIPPFKEDGLGRVYHYCGDGKYRRHDIHSAFYLKFTTPAGTVVYTHLETVYDVDVEWREEK